MALWILPCLKSMSQQKDSLLTIFLMMGPNIAFWILPYLKNMSKQQDILLTIFLIKGPACLFVCRCHGHGLILLLYVDDTILTQNDFSQ